MEGPIILRFENHRMILGDKDVKKPIDPEKRVLIIQLPGCFLVTDDIPEEADDLSEEPADPDYYEGGTDF